MENQKNTQETTKKKQILGSRYRMTKHGKD